MTIDWEVFWTSFLLAALGVIAWRVSGLVWDREVERRATERWLNRQAKKESEANAEPRHDQADH